MKKFFVGTVTACLLLTGCGDDESKVVNKPEVDKQTSTKPANFRPPNPNNFSTEAFA